MDSDEQKLVDRPLIHIEFLWYLDVIATYLKEGINCWLSDADSIILKRGRKHGRQFETYTHDILKQAVLDSCKKNAFIMGFKKRGGFIFCGNYNAEQSEKNKTCEFDHLIFVGYRDENGKKHTYLILWYETTLQDVSKELIDKKMTGIDVLKRGGGLIRNKKQKLSKIGCTVKFIDNVSTYTVHSSVESPLFILSDHESI